MKANEVQEVIEDTQKNKYLTFVLGKENYGFEIQYVTEIVGMQEITDVPDVPRSIQGVINLRGKIIPVMDARTKFGKDKIAYSDRTCIVVVEVKGLLIGVIVDAVSEVLTIEEDQMVPPPSIINTGSQYIKNIGKSQDIVTLLLDIESLLNQDELEYISN